MEQGRLGTARFAMLTIVDPEFDAVSQELHIEHNLPHTPYFCTGADEWEIVLRKSPGRGQVPAHTVASQTLEDFRPEVLVLVGIAGGIAGREGIQPGDVVAPNYLHYGEFRKLTSENDLRRYEPFDQPAVNIIESYVHPTKHQDSWHSNITVERPGGEGDKPKVVIGSLVAGEKLYGDPTHAEQRLLVRRHDDAVAVDMESFGVARAVFESRRTVDYNPRLLVVRGVSDLVHVAQDDEEAENPDIEAENDDQRKLWRPYACATVAAFAANVVRQLLEVKDPRSPTIPQGATDGKPT
jgi:nucleoside phosphorylase